MSNPETTAAAICPITKPLLAASCKNPNALKFPMLATRKIDGLRVLKIGPGLDQVVSRTFKPIRNAHIRKILHEVLPVGADGEVTAGATFQSSSSAVMGSEFKGHFTFHWFDYVQESLSKPYDA